MLSPSFIPQSVFYTQSVVRSPQSMFYTDLQGFPPFWKIRDHEALNYLLSQRYLKSSETNWKTIRHTLYVKYRTQGQFWVHELDSPCICLYTFSLISVRTSLDNSTWTNHRSHPNFGSIKGRNLLKVVKSFSSFLPEEQRFFFTTDEEATAMFTSKSNRWPHSGLDPVGSCAFWRQFYLAPWAREARWLEEFRFFEVIYLNFVGHHDPSLCPEGHLRPFRIALHPSRSLADAVEPPPPSPHDCHRISFRSLSTLLLQVVRGLPDLLLPSGAQVSAVLAMLLGTLSNRNADGDEDAETCEKTGERTPLWRKFTNIKQQHHQNVVVSQSSLLIFVLCLSGWLHWKKFAINFW